MKTSLQFLLNHEEQKQEAEANPTTHTTNNTSSSNNYCPKLDILSAVALMAN